MYPITYSPARNTIFLPFGFTWTEVLTADNINAILQRLGYYNADFLGHEVLPVT